MAFLGLLILPGCAPLGRQTERLVREVPPYELIANCPKPNVLVKTNGQLAASLLAMEAALDKCNLDKAALRLWSEQDD